ncbi:MAG: hypothetical protein J2P48_13600 [Alphaproteobacteria bacterium]|nr:hypothetical protein [Alphaproteobacteria bacterium]
MPDASISEVIRELRTISDALTRVLETCGSVPKEFRTAAAALQTTLRELDIGEAATAATEDDRAALLQMRTGMRTMLERTGAMVAMASVRPRQR